MSSRLSRLKSSAFANAGSLSESARHLTYTAAAVSGDWSWWERKTFQFFIRRGPLVGAAVPVVIGLALLYATTLAAALIAEHRIWTNSLEVTAVFLGGVGALVVTYLLGILALGALFTRSRYNRLLTLHQTMRDIREMSWVEFEQLVAANYASQGYEVEHVGKVGPDGGVDLKMRKDGELVLVQCKHYRNSWIYLLPLRQFLGTLEHFKADRGIFVTCGVFDETAEEFAKHNPRIQLVAGEQLKEMVQRAIERRPVGRTYICEKCRAPMKPKMGRRGLFLSCSNYPACKGSRDWPGGATE